MCLFKEHEYSFLVPKTEYSFLFPILKADDLEKFKHIIQTTHPIKDLYRNTKDRLTIMDYAVKKRALRIVKFLVNELEYDINSCNKRDHDPFYSAVADNQGRIARFLTKAGADRNDAIFWFGRVRVAITCGDLVFFQKQLKELFDVTSCDIEDFIRAAAESGWIHIINYLFKEFKINPGERGATIALENAFMSNRIRLVLWLIATEKVDISNLGIFQHVSNNTSAPFVKWLFTRHGIGGAFVDSALEQLVHNGCLKLNGENMGDTCCELIEHSRIWNKCLQKLVEIDLRDNPRIGKKGVEALIQTM